MHPRSTAPRPSAALGRGFALAAVLFGAATTAAADPPPATTAAAMPPSSAAPAAASLRTVLPVFVSYPANLVIYPDATSLRLAASHALAAALAARGRDVVTYPDLEPIMREAGVRSERDVGPGFLDAMVTELGAQEVVIATFSIYRDRLLLVARGLSPSSGRLTWVASVEEPRSVTIDPDEERVAEDVPDPTPELSALAVAASTRLAAISGAPGNGGDAGATVVVLPLHPVGVDRGPASLALHCLLRSLLATGRWSIPDPTAVVSALQQDGHDPLLLDAESRLLLGERFGTSTLLVPRLVAFPPTVGPTAPIPASGGALEDSGAPDRAWSADVPMQFSLVRIDCASGRILSGEGDYLAAQSPYGIFGTFRRIPLDRRFQAETDRLVAALLAPDRGDGK